MALASSLFLYLFYRSDKTLINELISTTLPTYSYATVKAYIAQALPMAKPIVFSLPGGLWVFSATALSQDFYLKVKHLRFEAGIIPVLFAVGLEFCQLLRLTNGTFDVLDIAFYVFFWFIAYYWFHTHRSERDLLSPFTLKGFFCVVCFLSVYLAHVNG